MPRLHARFRLYECLDFILAPGFMNSITIGAVTEMASVVFQTIFGKFREFLVDGSNTQKNSHYKHHESIDCSCIYLALVIIH